MPTYEYECHKCNQTFEVVQSFSDRPLKKHPECGGEVKKIFHARGVVFKGSGFYATDSRPARTSSSSTSTPSDSKDSSSSSSSASSDD